MSLNPLVVVGAVAALVFALSKDADAKEKEKPKLKPRPGQPTPGGRGEIPGVPSIPSPPGAGTEPAIPPSVLSRMVAALATGNSAEIRRVASQLEREGFPTQASELRAAADALDAAKSVPVPGPPVRVVAPPPGAVPVAPPKVITPPGLTRPPGSPPPFVPPEVRRPKRPKARKPKPKPAPRLPAPITKPPPIFTRLPVPARPPVKVKRPPPGAIPVPPPPRPKHPPGAIPDKATLIGKTALMLWESAPGPVRDVALLTRYKKSVGLRDPGRLYGPGTAKSLMARGIVPPTPWDWPRNRKKAAKDLSDNYKFKARQDKARREEWLQAAADLKPFL